MGLSLASHTPRARVSKSQFLFLMIENDSEPLEQRTEQIAKQLLLV